MQKLSFFAMLGQFFAAMGVIAEAAFHLASAVKVGAVEAEEYAKGIAAENALERQKNLEKLKAELTQA